MERTIAGFRQDEGGTWVADLSCLHSQHIRHQPPFRLAPWVLDDAERAARVGAAIECPLCDRAELPGGLEVVRTSERWTEATMPAGLRRAHRLAQGVWGQLQVEQGRLRLRVKTEPPIDVVIEPGRAHAIPPEVEHEVEPQGAVSFRVEFLRRPATTPPGGGTAAPTPGGG